jgi:hypothetical protein
MATALTAEGRDLFSRHLLGDSSTSLAAGSWLTLHSAQPGNSGSSQISGSRVAVSWSWDATNKWWTNPSPVSVPSVLGTVNWVALWHGAGTGNVWFEGQLASPFTMASSGSVLIPANALRLHAAATDASNKGGLTDAAVQYAVGHFLGVSSWSMPSSFTERTHSASAGATGGANIQNGSVYSATKVFEYQTGNYFSGLASSSPGYSGNSRYWSIADNSGNALCYGELSSGEQAWADYFGGGRALNGVDFSGADDSTSSFSGHTYTQTSMRLTLEAVAGIAAGDVSSGVITAAGTGDLTTIVSRKAPVTTLAGTGTFLVSVGSTAQARCTFAGTSSLQIGDSVPGSPFSQEGLLYETLVSMQILGTG